MSLSRKRQRKAPRKVYVLFDSASNIVQSGLIQSELRELKKSLGLRGARVEGYIHRPAVVSNV